MKPNVVPDVDPLSDAVVQLGSRSGAHSGVCGWSIGRSCFGLRRDAARS